VQASKASAEWLTPAGVAKYWKESIPLRGSRTAYLVLPVGLEGVDCSLSDGDTIQWRGQSVIAIASPAPTIVSTRTTPTIHGLGFHGVAWPTLRARLSAYPLYRTSSRLAHTNSVVSTARFPTAAVYSATKAAVDAVTRSLATELGPRHIRVNSINPGMVETEGVHAAGIAESDMRKQTEAQTPLGRIGQPQDIAPAVAFLASADAAWITGETLFISGGLR